MRHSGPHEQRILRSCLPLTKMSAARVADRTFHGRWWVADPWSPQDDNEAFDGRPQVLMPNSRSAWFSDVLRSVEAVRWPTIRAQPTWNSPAGNWRRRVPGTTTERAGTRPR